MAKGSSGSKPNSVLSIADTHRIVKLEHSYTSNYTDAMETLDCSMDIDEIEMLESETPVGFEGLTELCNQLTLEPNQSDDGVISQALLVPIGLCEEFATVLWTKLKFHINHCH